MPTRGGGADVGAMEDALASSAVFGRAGTLLRGELARASTPRRYARGERIMTAGDEARHVFLLSRGMVRVFHEDRGREVVLKVFRGPALFGEAEALTSRRFVQNVDAVEEADALVMPVDAVVALLRRAPSCALALLIDVAGRLAVASQNQKSIAFDPVSVRLSNYLVDYGLWTNDADAVELRLELNQDDMAAAVGATRRAVAQAIARWQEEGLLARRGKGYVIRDAATLRRYGSSDLVRLTYSLSDQRQLIEAWLGPEEA